MDEWAEHKTFSWETPGDCVPCETKSQLWPLLGFVFSCILV